jgi:O-antigen/teichoic acid export membrane protein
MKKRISREIKDVLYLIALQGLNYIAPMLVLPYLMKVLGAEKFGYIGFSLTVMQYLMLVVDFGFNLSTTKRVALAKDNPNELNKIFTSTLYAKIGLLMVSFLVLLIFMVIPAFAVYRETMLVMFLTVIASAFTFVWLFQGLGKIRFISIFHGVAKLLILPLTFVFVRQTSDYLTAALLQSLVAVFASVISILYVIKNHWVKITSFVKKDILYELKESYPIFLSGAAISIYTASFVVILGYFFTSKEVGQYTAAERIMRAFCALIFVTVSQAFYPKISQLGKENRTEAVKMLRKILLFIVSCMLLVFVAMFFLSPYLVEFLGKDYHDSLLLFRIMAFVPIFVGAGGVVAQLAILALGDEKDKKRYQRVYFIAGLVAIVCVFATVPFLGAIGAALSLLLTEMLVCVLMFWNGRKFFTCC